MIGVKSLRASWEVTSERNAPAIAGLRAVTRGVGDTKQKEVIDFPKRFFLFSYHEL